GPAAEMTRPPDHLFVPLRQNYQISIALVQHHPVVRKRLLHVAFFAFTGLNQRHECLSFRSPAASPAGMEHTRFSLIGKMAAFLQSKTVSAVFKFFLPYDFIPQPAS